MAHGYFRNIDTFRQRHAAEGPEAGGGAVFVKAAMDTSLCMEKVSDQLTLGLVFARCLPPPHHFVKHSVVSRGE